MDRVAGPHGVAHLPVGLLQRLVEFGKPDGPAFPQDQAGNMDLSGARQRGTLHAGDRLERLQYRGLTATRRQAIERLFKVTVLAVRTVHVRGKAKRLGRFQGRRPDWKKAIATLKPGDSIELYEGV
jgi:hypothetical protein